MYARLYFLALFSIIANVNTSAQSWQALNGPTGAGTVVSIITYEKGEIYTLIISGKMFRSLDKAKTWENISAGLEQIANNVTYNSKIKESPTGEIFMSVGILLYKFIPATKSWITVSKDIEIEDFAFSPDGNTIYVGTYSELYISVNESKFNKIQTWGKHSVELLCLGNNNNFVKTTQGVDGEIWQFNDDGSNPRVVTTSDCCRSFFFHKKSKTLFDLDYQIRISKDFGLTWINLVLQDNMYFDKMLELEDGSILGFLNNKTYKSIDDGNSWIEDFSYDLISNFYVGPNADLSKSKKDEVVICNKRNSYYLDDKGNSYTFEMPVLESNAYEIVQFGEKNIFCKTSSNNQLSKDDGSTWNILPIKNNYLYWKDGTIAYYTYDSIIVSIDQFNTQQAKVLPEFITSENLLLDNNENIVLLAYGTSYISYDKGDSWKLIGENLEIPTSVEKFKISKQNIIYGCGTMDTIYYSTDYGITWKDFIGSLDAFFPYEVFLSNNNVFFWENLNQSNGFNVSKFSADFGKTIEELKLQINERIWLIDEYDNVYTRGLQNVNSLKVTNILTKKVSYISLNGLNLTTNENIEVVRRGINGYLYTAKTNSPVYKYSEKFENELGIISGKVFIDENQDCIKSNAELNTRAFQMEVSSSRSNFEVPVLADGNFKVYLAPGDYKFNLKSKSLLWEQCNFPTSVNVQANIESQYNELLVKPIEYCADLSTNVVLSRLRRCFDNNFAYLTIKNEGSISSKNSIVTVFMDDYFEKIQSSLSPTAVNANLWTFNISEIKPGETFRINFKFTVSCKASINQEHCIKYITENEQACKGFSSLMDTSIVCEKNIGSFDPNDKTVLINGKSTDFLYEKDSILEYLIRFQNTGTDTAFNIRLTDKLDYNLDWTSLIALTASHDYTYSVNEQGLLEVFFKDIMLADSNISEANSHGYFKFSIKPKPGINFGTLINNVADIYFDFNEAVRTNFAKLTLTPILKTKNIGGEKILELKAIPNPANQVTEIALPDSWYNSLVHARVLSLDGKLVQSFDISTNKIILERNNLYSGMYYLNLIHKSGKRAYCKIIFN